MAVPRAAGRGCKAGMQRRGRLSPDGRAASITRCANPLPPLLPSLHPRSAPARCRREPSGAPGAPQARTEQRLPPARGREGSGARLCPCPGQVRALPRGGGGTSTGGTGQTERPGDLEFPAPGWLCRGLGRSCGSGTAPSRGLVSDSRAHKPGAGLEAAPLRSETAANSARAGATAWHRAPLGRGTGGPSRRLRCSLTLL